MRNEGLERLALEPENSPCLYDDGGQGSSTGVHQEMAAPFRTIVSRNVQHEEHVGRRSWWMVEITTLTLQCGHTKVYRGCGVPREKVRCRTCSETNSPSAITSSL